MILYDYKDFYLLKDDFPNLYYDEKSNAVKGELDFSAHYRNVGKKNKDRWKIFPCLDTDDCLQGCYEVDIKLGDNLPVVYETSQKIKKIAEKLGKSYNDLHLYDNDYKCCLGLAKNNNIKLSTFIVNWVYPYFVWQAYYAKYNKVPPCGEYSHNFEVAKQEFFQNLRKLGVNDYCFCGSGKKYKYCHLPILKQDGII